MRILKERRRNPSVNKKRASIDILKGYVKYKNLFISFTEINKLGINPQSKYDTPLGIYTYPLAAAWEHYGAEKKISRSPDTKVSDIFPFAAKMPFIQVMELDSGNMHILHIDEQSHNQDFSEEIGILFKWFTAKHGSNREAFDTLVTKAKDTARRPASSISVFWNLTNLLAQISTKAPVAWRYILNKVLGYDAVIDYGEGIIHPNEECQAVFFNASDLTVKTTIVNVSPSTFDKAVKDKLNDGTPLPFAVLKQYINSQDLTDDDTLLTLVALLIAQSEPRTGNRSIKYLIDTHPELKTKKWPVKQSAIAASIRKYMDGEALVSLLDMVYYSLQSSQGLQLRNEGYGSINFDALPWPRVSLSDGSMYYFSSFGIYHMKGEESKRYSLRFNEQGYFAHMCLSELVQIPQDNEQKIVLSGTFKNQPVFITYAYSSYAPSVAPYQVVVLNNNKLSVVPDISKLTHEFKTIIASLRNLSGNHPEVVKTVYPRLIKCGTAIYETIKKHAPLLIREYADLLCPDNVHVSNFFSLYIEKKNTALQGKLLYTIKGMVSDGVDPDNLFLFEG